MAKQAKEVASKAAPKFTDKDVTKFVADIRQCDANIESARGAFMRQARQERDEMQAVYESMAAKGLAQKIAKTEMQIIRYMEKIKKLTADLDYDQRRMLERLARAQDDRRQLSLLLEVPRPEKPAKAARAAKAKSNGKAANVVPIKPAETTGDAPSAA